MIKNQHGFAHAAVIIGLIVVVLVGIAGWKVATSDRKNVPAQSTTRSGSSSTGSTAKSMDCTAAQSGIFTSNITTLPAVTLIQNPIRIIGGSNIKTHSYIEVKQRSPVYAPMDSTVTGGANYYETMGPNPVTKVQYLLAFNNGCDVNYWFDHIVDVPDGIRQAFPAEVSNDTKAVAVKPLKVKAGELIGYSNQTGTARFDFGVVDRKGKGTILTTDSRFKDNEIVKTSDKYRHAVCPFQFYNPADAKQYAALFDTTPDPDQEIVDNLCKDL